MRPVTLSLPVIALLLGGPALAAESGVSEIRLRSGEILYGRVLQEDSAWVVVDIKDGVITSIERARVERIQPAPAVGAAPAAPTRLAPAAAQGRDWQLGATLAWGWSSNEWSADYYIQDSGVAIRRRISQDDQGFDGFPTLFLTLMTERPLVDAPSALFGAQLVLAPGDAFNDDAWVWSLEGVTGLRWDGVKRSFDLRLAGGPTYSSGSIEGRITGSQGTQTFTTTDTVSGWVLRAEAAALFWLQPAMALDITLGLAHRRMYPDMEFSTTNYSGHIDGESVTTGVYLGVGLHWDL